jgi:hypothetical protein
MIAIIRRTPQQLTLCIDVQDLLPRLSGLPLTPVQAGAYIGVTGITVGKYTFIFLTLALGAGRVRRVADVAEARLLVERDGDGVWGWVYVDFALAESGRVLFGMKGSGAAGDVGGDGRGGKKRRKGGVKDGHGAAGAGAAQGRNVLSRTDGRVRLVNDEFVVQSLILGDLVE